MKDRASLLRVHLGTSQACRLWRDSDETFKWANSTITSHCRGRSTPHLLSSQTGFRQGEQGAGKGAINRLARDDKDTRHRFSSEKLTF